MLSLLTDTLANDHSIQWGQLFGQALTGGSTVAGSRSGIKLYKSLQGYIVESL